MNSIPFFDTPAAFAMRIGQLSTRLYDQMDRCLTTAGVRLPGYTTSIVQALYHGGPLSISDLAQQLELSHQLASQRVKWLVKGGYAAVASGARDRRTRIVSLSRAGRTEAEKLQRFLPDLELAYADLFEEVELDLHDAAIRSLAALADRPLDARFNLLAPAPASTAGRSR